MKVVIAKNGGFYPSKKLVDRLVELGMTIGRWEEGKLTAEQAPEILYFPGDPKELIRRHRVDHWYFRDDIQETRQKFRTDPRLIQAIEEIGVKEAIEQEDGDEEFKIIEIPDGVQFFITEGECSISEHIEECHRIWS